MTSSFFAWTVIGLSACACIQYIAAGDLRHALYWACAVGLNVSVTWR